MKLYVSGRTPNPRRVKIVLAEKGVEIPTVELDITKMEHKDAQHLARNAVGEVPVLELDDGRHLAESVAICRYFEALYPEPPLFGVDPLDGAFVEMWNRRLELKLYEPIRTIFRHSHPAMAQLELPQVPEWAEANRPKLSECLGWLDRELATREFIAGDRFSFADITGIVALDFMRVIRTPVPEEHCNLMRWREAMHARPSVSGQ